MRKYIVLSMAFIISCAFIILPVSNNDDYPTHNISVTEETGYTLKEYNGQLAIYKNDETTPFKVYEIQVNTLPEHDKNNLQNGICVKNENELNQLISDFTS